MSILDLLQYIVNEPAPRLGDPWGSDTVEGVFTDRCLEKDPNVRPSPSELLVRSSLLVLIASFWSLLPDCFCSCLSMGFRNSLG